jgi:hypothetical protein
MLASDGEAAAGRSAQMIEDSRIRHFYDPERRVGKIIAQSLGGPESIAWDIYLFYKPEDAWDSNPPMPTNWAHQLARSSWADPARYRVGDDLVKELKDITQNLTTVDSTTN